MNLHEYQTKSILAENKVPVPRGKVARTAAEAAAVFKELGLAAAAVKAQVHAGGRGKAGGIKLVRSAAEAEAAAKELLGNRLKTYQTGPEGLPVHAVLVEEATQAVKEFYVGMTLDRSRGALVMMVSKHGGMDIEEIARTQPGSIVKETVETTGLKPYQARKLAYALGLDGDLHKAAVAALLALARVYLARDASLMEINPLAVSSDNRLLALDGKLNIDDRAASLKPETESLRDTTQEDPTEVEANKIGLNYVSMTGNIGCMVNGAGLAMATMDIIKHHGGMPANFLDVGGGANKDQIVAAFKLLLANPGLRAVLINIFGGILKCDVLAQGIVEAVKEVGLTLPLVVRMEGTNVDRGRQILKESGLKLEAASDMGDAARKAVAAARG
jgi:succinyl-CoA synthetase beta subunit